MSNNEIEVLNSKISECEKKRINLLYQLGKEYFEVNKNSTDDKFMDSISAILEIDSSIASHKKRIDELNNVVRCKSCGAVLEKGALFCAECGARVVEEKPTKICPQCGKEVDEDSAFCSGCGHKFETTECPECGAILEGTPSFCMNCGHSFVE